MRTIAVIARKGGSGKTTVAINLGIAAHRRGLKTLLADSDPQRSLADVLKSRRQADPAIVETNGRGLLAVQLTARRAGVDALIIDTAAGEEEDFSHSIVLADLLVLVVRPTLLDFAALVRTLRVIQHLRKPAMVVLNQAPARRSGIEPPAVRKGQEALRLLRLTASPAILRTRAAYQSALERGCSVEEQIADAAASTEISDLWSSVHQAAFGPGERWRREPASEFIMGDRALF
jgi:chromosome partitioning protein